MHAYASIINAWEQIYRNNKTPEATNFRSPLKKEKKLIRFGKKRGQLV